MLLDIGRDVDRFDVFKVPEPGSLTPIQKQSNRMIISDAGILVPDRDRKKLKETLGSFGPDVGDNGWNLKSFCWPDGEHKSLNMKLKSLALDTRRRKCRSLNDAGAPKAQTGRDSADLPPAEVNSRGRS
jgi:hypothetical protein